MRDIVAERVARKHPLIFKSRFPSALNNGGNH